MADGGAWHSGVFDNSTKQGYTPLQGPGADHVAAGVPPPMYNQPPPSQASGAANGAAKGTTIIAIILRVATVVFTVVAFAIIASNRGEKSGLIYDWRTETWRYWNVKWNIIKNSAAAFLLAANVIVCCYSLVQLVVSLVRGCVGSRMLSGPTTPAATITSVCDQAMTYLMMGACGAGTCHAVYNSKVNFIDGEDLCDRLRILCDRQISSVVISFLAFVCIALSVALHNFRVYKVATKLA